jgi:hypothetical protein
VRQPTEARLIPTPNPLNPRVAPGADALRAALPEAVAGSWVALGAELEGRAVPHVIDIEALVVATARLADHLDKATLAAAVAWCARFGWAVSGARLSSVADELAAPVPTAAFAGSVAAAGGVRWPNASGRLGGVTAGARQAMHVTDLGNPARLMWRLRSAFGTASRADVLLVLMGAPEPLATAEIARGARYTKAAVAAAVDGLALAGLVDVVRVGREDRVALRQPSILAAWQAPADLPVVDGVARWRVSLEALAVLEATRDLASADAADAQRAVVLELAEDLARTGLPSPNLLVRGPVFSVHVDWWAGDLAASWWER